MSERKRERERGGGGEGGGEGGIWIQHGPDDRTRENPRTLTSGGFLPFWTWENAQNYVIYILFHTETAPSSSCSTHSATQIHENAERKLMLHPDGSRCPSKIVACYKLKLWSSKVSKWFRLVIVVVIVYITLWLSQTRVAKFRPVLRRRRGESMFLLCWTQIEA